MQPLLIGYVRVSTDAQDLTAQRDALAALGRDTGAHHVGHGLAARLSAQGIRTIS